MAFGAYDTTNNGPCVVCGKPSTLVCVDCTQAKNPGAAIIVPEEMTYICGEGVQCADAHDVMMHGGKAHAHA